MRYIYLSIICLLSLSAAAQQNRLIAISKYAGQKLLDSTRYWYTGNNGSNRLYASPHINKNDLFKLQGSNNTYTLYGLLHDGELSIDGTAYTQADSAWRTFRDINGQLDATTFRQQISPQGKLLSFDDDNIFGKYTCTISYGPNGKISKIQYCCNPTVSNYNQTTWYFYNAKGLLIKDSTYSANPPAWVGKWVYEYDANDNRTAASFYVYDSTLAQWVKSAEETMTYYPNSTNSNLLKTQVFANNTIKDTFGYTGNHMEYTYYERLSYDATNQLWKPNQKNIATVDADGYYDTLTIYSYNAQTKAYKLTFSITTTYSADHRRLTDTQWDYDATTQSLQYYATTTYYYENYPFPVGIEDMDNASIVLYPNPAKDQLNIQLQDNDELQLLIYNINGQLLKQQQITDHKATVDLQQIPEGMYRAVFYNKYSEPIYSRSFIKQ